MARVIPTDIVPSALSGVHSHEIETLLYLKDNLPDNYIVFHSIHWTNSIAKEIKVGEVDFVIVDNSGKILVIEQKNGFIEETEYGLIKKYGVIEKNVAAQIHRSIDNIYDKFKRLNTGVTKKLSIDYLFYCPDHKLKSLNAAGLDRNRIVDATQVKRLPSVVRNLMGKSDEIDKEWRKKVTDFFLHTFQLVPDVHSYISAHEKAYTRFSGGLAKLIDNLEISPFRLLIRGTGGCGKSQLAQVYYDRMVDSNHRPLLLCFNRPLAEKLKSAVQHGGMVNTWYGFCAEYVENIGYHLDFTKMNSNPNFWKQVEEMVVSSDILPDWKFDTLIIDEGQDFQEEWYEILQLFLDDEFQALWLEARHQNIRDTIKFKGGDFVVYNAKENYRTPRLIADFIQQVLPFEFECGNPLPGLGVGVTTYDHKQDQIKIVASIVENLIKQGFLYHDIAIISFRGVTSSALSDIDEIKGVKLSKFTGKYDSNKNQIITDGDLIFDSIYRYKGQQAPAIIFTDIDPENDNAPSLERLFSGMTRATVRLELLVNKNNKINRKILKANRL